jgi:hypothetical protein
LLLSIGPRVRTLLARLIRKGKKKKKDRERKRSTDGAVETLYQHSPPLAVLCRRHRSRFPSPRRPRRLSSAPVCSSMNGSITFSAALSPTALRVGRGATGYSVYPAPHRQIEEQKTGRRRDGRRFARPSFFLHAPLLIAPGQRMISERCALFLSSPSLHLIWSPGARRLAH